MARKTTWYGVLAIMAPILAACTAEGPLYSPASSGPGGNTGIIYVYRPLGTTATRGESPFVSVGGKNYGAMKAGSYVAANVPEGEVKVMVQQSMLMLVPTIPRSVTVTVVAGGVSYVKVDQMITDAKLSGGVTVMQSVAIEEVSEAEGQAALQESRKND